VIVAFVGLVIVACVGLVIVGDVCIVIDDCVGFRLLVVLVL
jgi:hypothetical protein